MQPQAEAVEALRQHYLSRVGASAHEWVPEDADLLLLLDNYSEHPDAIRHALSATAQRVRSGGCTDPAAYLHGTARRLANGEGLH